MRIGIVTGEYPPMQGGIATHCHLLAQKLCDNGDSIFIFSDVKAQQQDDIDVTTYKGRWDYRALSAINRWADNLDLDVIDMHFQTAAYQMSPWIHFLPDFVDKPVITTFHDLRFPYLFPKAGWLRDWIVMRLAQSSEGVVVTNYDDFEHVKSLPLVEVIPIGSNIVTEPAESQDWRSVFGLSVNDFVIAHFGFVNHSKGVDHLIEALKLCNRPHFKLLMIGDKTGSSDPTNADYVATIEQLIEHLGLEEQIIWTGFLDEAMAIRCLVDADVVVLPFRDGASLRRSSLIVAINWGCPIITTYPTHPMPDFDDKALLLVDKDQSYDLAQGIIRIADEHGLRETLKIGVQKLHKYFDWSDIVAKKHAFYQRVVESNQR